MAMIKKKVKNDPEERVKVMLKHSTLACTRGRKAKHKESLAF